MDKEQTLTRIQRELQTASAAQHTGNDGMARVCARRAAGEAIGFWLDAHPHPDWGDDAMNRLRSAQADASIPEVVRQAALRLTTKVTEQFHSPFSTDPIEDSRIIIDYFMEKG